MFSGNTRTDNVVYAADIHERAKSDVSSQFTHNVATYTHVHQSIIIVIIIYYHMRGNICIT